MTQPNLPSRRAPLPVTNEPPEQNAIENTSIVADTETRLVTPNVTNPTSGKVSFADLFDTNKMAVPQTSLDINQELTETVLGMNNSPYFYTLVHRAMEEGRPILYDIPRYTVPGGGNNAFRGSDGTMVNEYVGVVLSIHNIRQFYFEERREDGPNALPICISIDSRNGIGNPGGKCQTCPHRQISAGSRVYCRRKTWMFLAVAGESLPILIDMTGAASMGLNSQTIPDSYLRHKLPIGLRVEHLVSRFRLETHPNYNQGDRKASIIKGEVLAQTDWNTNEYSTALDFVKAYLQGVVENWSDYMSENMDVSQNNVYNNVVESALSEFPEIPDDVFNTDDDLPF